MKNQGSRNRSIMLMVVFAILVLCSQAQAAGFPGFDRDSASRPTISPLEQASSWIRAAWGELTSVFAADGATNPPPPTAQVCPADPRCDAGWGLDPEG